MTDTAALAQAVAQIQRGGLVALPTETVYGLAADADNPTAVARIFASKGRPSDHPLIVHVAAPEHALHYAREIPAFAQALMQTFWPGPLTLILPKRAQVADAACGGQASIGLRCPAHPVAQALLHACHAVGIHGLAAPSANRFGRISPTTAAHVRHEFASALDADALLVLDGGPCAVGIESTIIDCSRGQPVLLRPGMLSVAALQACMGLPVQWPDAQAPRASGTLASHYAPQARLRLWSAQALQQAVDTHAAQAASIAIYHRTALLANQAFACYPMPSDAAACAHELFAVLRALDRPETAQIWVESPPTDPAWDGVRDRLQRAAH